MIVIYPDQIKRNNKSPRLGIWLRFIKTFLFLFQLLFLSQTRSFGFCVSKQIDIIRIRMIII